MTTTDADTQTRSGSLVREEHESRAGHVGASSDESEQERLEEIERQLDRGWDLLNQRLALRESGGDPDDAAMRDVDTVEDYLQ